MLYLQSSCHAQTALFPVFSSAGALCLSSQQTPAYTPNTHASVMRQAQHLIPRRNHPSMGDQPRLAGAPNRASMEKKWL
jgi:hypothetical protein